MYEIKWEVRKLTDCLESSVTESNGFFCDRALLQVNISTFKIKNAEIISEKKVGSNTVVRKENFDELCGIDAYIHGKKEIKCVLQKNGRSERVNIFVQCVSALVQAETYVYRERGYKSKEEYNLYWDIIENDGCRMYSASRKAFRKEDKKWMDYVPDNFNRELLFFRRKTYEKIFGESDVKYLLKLNDSYHEMNIEIFTNADKICKSMNISVIRAPGVACFTNKINESKLIGHKLTEINKKWIIENFGKSDGCYHIVELLTDWMGLFLNEPEISD